jgi:hypothetical protein
VVIFLPVVYGRCGELLALSRADAVAGVQHVPTA